MHDVEHLQVILILLAAAVCIVGVCKLLRLSPVIGYLAAGAAIGPHGFSIIEDVKTTSAIAEFGVIFLLFLIGLELSLDRLAAMRRLVFGLGSAQVFVTALCIGVFAKITGLASEASIIIAGGLALSSTAIVLKVLEETGDAASQSGRLAFAVLLLQDLIVVPLLVLVPLLSDGSGSILGALASAGVKAVVALVGIFVAGRLLLRPLFNLIASFRNPELFVATTLLVVFGISWLTYIAGLSLALGAFIAGLLIAETEYQHQVEADVKQNKGLFLGLFFMSVGMAVDVELLARFWWVILTLALALMAVKIAIMLGLFRLFRFGWGTSFKAAFLLSQGGEFAFILFSLANQQGVLEDGLTQILLVVTTATMALTPLAAALGKKLARTSGLMTAPLLQNNARQQETQDMEGHVVIAGFGRMGQTIARLLTEEKIPFVALDLNPANIAHGKKKGKPVYYGDSSRMDVLHSVGIERARAAIVTLKDRDGAERAVRALRTALPDLPIITRARDMHSSQSMLTAGATAAVPEVFEGSLQVGAALLKILGVPEQEIARIIDLLRARGYAMIREEGMN